MSGSEMPLTSSDQSPNDYIPGPRRQRGTDVLDPRPLSRVAHEGIILLIETAPPSPKHV
jgi:hypothetical protein